MEAMPGGRRVPRRPGPGLVVVWTPWSACGQRSARTGWPGRLPRRGDPPFSPDTASRQPKRGPADVRVPPVLHQGWDHQVTVVGWGRLPGTGATKPGHCWSPEAMPRATLGHAAPWAGLRLGLAHGVGQASGWRPVCWVPPALTAPAPPQGGPGGCREATGHRPERALHQGGALCLPERLPGWQRRYLHAWVPTSALAPLTVPPAGPLAQLLLPSQARGSPFMTLVR